MKSISLLSGYIYLIFAIVTGIASNGFLKTTEGFTKLNPTIFCVSSIIICLFCISKAMTVIPVGFTYATYGALTITAVTFFGIFKYNQTPNLYGTLGLVFIIIGSIFEIFDGTLSLISETLFKDGIVPDYINTPSLIIQVVCFLLAIIFSTINLFRNKSNRIVYFCAVIMSMSLFLARLSWLINNIRWSYFS